MASDDSMARALAAEGPMTVMIGGIECRVRPLGIQELTEVEQDCVSRYKRQYLETFSSNLDLLPNGGEGLMREKIEEVAKWGVDDLPRKAAYDTNRVKLTDSVKAFLAESFEIDPANTPELKMKRMVATALDQGMLDEKQYVVMTDSKPFKLKVPYVNWWITGSYDGMISFVWMCFRYRGVTRVQVVEAMRENPSLLIDLSREIERLSAPKLGNG